ncbi:BnaA04g07240D [Brassica napus]|uniref:BnaA04g07240D protein n=2 Tax=Brassica TaxID=3705 RepID=A0A078HQ20_BRANA|nr:BnaA04g07240D [Brassica napus]VDD11723.1 unnamed protein product [Brassica rapa]
MRPAYRSSKKVLVNDKLEAEVISQLYYLGGKYKGDLFCHSGGDRGFVLTVDGGKDRCIIKEKEIKILKLNVKTLDKAGISTAS